MPEDLGVLTESPPVEPVVEPVVVPPQEPAEEPEDLDAMPEGLGEKAQVRFQKLANGRREAIDALAKQEALSVHLENLGFTWDGENLVEKAAVQEPFKPPTPVVQQVVTPTQQEQDLYALEYVDPDLDDSDAPSSIAANPAWKTEAQRQGIGNPERLDYGAWEIVKSRARSDRQVYNQQEATSYEKATEWLNTDPALAENEELKKEVERRGMEAVKNGTNFQQLTAVGPGGDTWLDMLKYQAIGRQVEAEKGRAKAEATRARSVTATQPGSQAPITALAKSGVTQEVRERAAMTHQDPDRLAAELAKIRSAS